MATKGGGAHKSGGGGAFKSSSPSSSSRSSYSPLSYGSYGGYRSGGDLSDLSIWQILLLIALVVLILVVLVWFVNQAQSNAAAPSSSTGAPQLDATGQWVTLPAGITAESLPNVYTEADSNCYTGCVVYFDLPAYGGQVALYGNWTEVSPNDYMFYPQSMWGEEGYQANETWAGPTDDGEGVWVEVPAWLTSEDVPEAYVEEDSTCYTGCTIYVNIPELGGDVTLNGDWVETEPGSDTYVFVPYYIWEQTGR